MGIRTREEVARQALKRPHRRAPTDLRVGDIVTFTNDFGIQFEGHRVVGFADPDENGGRSVYIDFDCYWFPVAIHSLSKS